MLTTEEDWPSVRRYLASQGMAMADIPPQRFTSGLANRNYLVQLETGPVVLRRPPSGPLPPGAHDMAREHRILSRLHTALPLAPRSIHLCTDPGIMGASFQLLEFRPGLVIRAALPSRYERNGAFLSETLVHTLSAIHAVDPARVGLDDLGRPHGFLARSVAGWHKRGQAVARPETASLLDTLHRWLERKIVPDSAPTLLHGDFKLDNLILDETTLQPNAIVDWDQGTRGDPLFDLATLLSYWAEPSDPAAMHALRQMPTAEPGFMTRTQVVSSYARATGRDVSDFRFHRVLGLVKLGVIFLQLGEQYRTGATADTRYAEFGTIGEGILTFAHGAAMGEVF